MLPAEITKLSGSDFDVDKLYIMLPEFQVKKNYDMKRAWDDFYTDPDNADIQDQIDRNANIALEDYRKQHPEDSDIDLDDYLEWVASKGIKKYQFADKVENKGITVAQERFSKWFKARKNDYFENYKIEKLKYDYNKPAYQQKPFRDDGGRARRNNALIDMMWGILTSPDTASKILNPGDFNKQKMADRVVTILDSMTEKELTDAGYTRDSLLKASYDISNLDKLDKLAKRAKRKLDPLSPRTQVIIHQQNMTGGSMIGIYANHNANHALMQHTELAVSEKYGSFKFAGIRRTSLHNMTNERLEYISRNTANFLAASVDNVKDNTLHATNQNTFTGDASMLLSRLGYNPTEIAILMRQPIVMEITRKYFRESREGKSKNSIIKEVLESTARWANMYDNLSWANVKEESFNLDVLMKDIQLYKSVDTMSEKDKQNFYRRQVAVGLLFQRVMKTADSLSGLVAATRADTQGGGAGPTIADSMINMQKINDFLKKASSEEFPLVGTDVIKNDIKYNGDTDTLRNDLLNSRLPFLQAFYTLGVQETSRMLSPYFPHFTKPFMEVLEGRKGDEGAEFEGLRDITKTGKLDVKTINSIYNDLLAYIMSKTEFFGSGRNEKGKVVSATEKRRDFINHFPAYFKKLVNNPDNKDIADLEFIQRLKTVLSSDKNPVSVLVFKNVGRLSPTLRERYMRDWASLLYMRNPKAQELALNLFLYSYYRNGFAFGPSTFIHLAPTAIRDAIDGYLPTLRGLLNAEDDYRDFIEQYVFNHLDNRNLVPEIPNTATIKFTDSKGKVLDDVIFYIHDSSSAGNMAAVKKELKDENGKTIYEFCRFIGKRIGNKWYYYMRVFDSNEPLDDNKAHYTRIEPLGYKNSFIEYEYGKKAWEVESVIDRNKKNYDPTTVYAARSGSENDIEDSLNAVPNYSKSLRWSEKDIRSAAFAAKYGESPEAESAPDSFDTIAPNTDFRDADDQKICGGDPFAGSPIIAIY